MIDVDRLVEELTERVEEQRRAGAYADDPSALPLDLPPPEAPVRFRPERAYSTKPVVGRPLTMAKQGLLRLLVHVFDDLAAQTSAAIEADRRDARQAEAALRTRIEEHRAGAGPPPAGPAPRPPGARPHGAARPGARRRQTPRPPRPAGRSHRGGAPARLPGLRGALPRLRGGDPGPPGHLPRAARRGAGASWTWAAAAASWCSCWWRPGSDAYGVELNADFVDLVRGEGPRGGPRGRRRGTSRASAGRRGRHRRQPRGRAPAARTSCRSWCPAAWERLPEGGVLIMETPNPESLVGGLGQLPPRSHPPAPRPPRHAGVHLRERRLRRRGHPAPVAGARRRPAAAAGPRATGPLARPPRPGGAAPQRPALRLPGLRRRRSAVGARAHPLGRAALRRGLIGGARRWSGAWPRGRSALGWDCEVATTCASTTSPGATTCPPAPRARTAVGVTRFPVDPRDEERPTPSPTA